MAALMLAYAGLGSYCLATALGQGTGAAHLGGISRSVAAAAAARVPETSGQPGAAGQAADSPDVSVAGKAHAANAFARALAAAMPARAEVLAAVSATAIGPAGSSGDHPQLASFVLDGNSATSWITHWYLTARFGNLKEGTGLVLDMGKTVTIRQVQLALGGIPGLRGADIQIRVGDSPRAWNQPPAAQITNAGGWVSCALPVPETGRYVQIWFTKLPLDSWGTYQEHVYGVTVHGSPAPGAQGAGHPRSAGWHDPGHGGPQGAGHHDGGGRSWGGGYGGGHGGGYGHHGHGR
jgi:hypothetical protein